MKIIWKAPLNKTITHSYLWIVGYGLVFKCFLLKLPFLYFFFLFLGWYFWAFHKMYFRRSGFDNPSISLLIIALFYKNLLQLLFHQGFLPFFLQHIPPIPFLKKAVYACHCGRMANPLFLPLNKLCFFWFLEKSKCDFSKFKS